ncbi:small GTPase superfamily [Mycena filopes]|nr:small GTPase superfamily [Mycena filopes]
MDEWTVFLLGDAGVGKSTFALQFSLNYHHIDLDNIDPLIDLEGPCSKALAVDDYVCLMELIEQENYAHVKPPGPWVQERQGLILMYSVASRATFDRLKLFRKSIARIPDWDPVFMLVGNKCDLSSAERQVSPEEGAALARKFGCEFLETSAKADQNVNPACRTLVRAIRRAGNQDIGARKRIGSEGMKRVIMKCIIL